MVVLSMGGVFYKHGTVYVTVDQSNFDEASFIMRNLPLIIHEKMGLSANNFYFHASHLEKFEHLKWDMVSNKPVVM